MMVGHWWKYVGKSVKATCANFSKCGG